MPTPHDRRALLAALWQEVPLEPLTPDARGQPLLEALLRGRARAAYLPAAAPWPEQPARLVHDVRVATRRLSEALALAAPMVGTKRARRARAGARRLRRTLGALRESHVLVQSLSAFADQLSPRALKRAKRLARRGDADPERVKAALPPEALLAEAVDMLLLAVTPQRDLTLCALAGKYLSERIERLEDQLPAIEEEGAAAAQHRLRIAVKRSRYAAEILREAYPAAFGEETTAAPLRALQDALGDLNDARQLASWLRRPEVEEELGRKLTRRLEDRLEVELQGRFEAARRLVRATGPSLVAALRRAGAAIGP